MRPLIWVGGRGTPPGNCKVAFATSCPAAGPVNGASSHTLCRSFPAESLNLEKKKMEQLSWHFGGQSGWGEGKKKSHSFVSALFFSMKLLE